MLFRSYPTDNWVGVAFTNANFHNLPEGGAIALGTASTTANTATNGIAWSTDGALSWAGTLTGAAGAPFSNIDILTIGLSGDFSWTDNAGTIAIGGQWEAGTTTVYQANVNTLRANTVVGSFTAVAEGTASAATTAATLDVGYTYSQDPVALARLFRTATNTYGQIQIGRAHV